MSRNRIFTKVRKERGEKSYVQKWVRRKITRHQKEQGHLRTLRHTGSGKGGKQTTGRNDLLTQALLES